MYTTDQLRCRFMEGWNGNDPLQAEHCALIITPLVSKRVPAKLTGVIKDVNAGVLQAPSPEPIT